MSDWLKVMLEEIERKKLEAEEQADTQPDQPVRADTRPDQDDGES